MRQFIQNLQKFTLIGVAVLLVVSPVADAKLRKWNQKMQELTKTITELLPELSDSRPITPAVSKQLEKGAKKILDLAHTINMGPGTAGNPLPPEADPTIGFISNLFERQAKHAYNATQTGHTAYARSVLRAMTGYCIACHTRHSRGPDFPTLNLTPKTASLTPMERAELLAATRQFDASLDAFEAIVADKKLAKEKPFEWGRALRHAFTIVIRVKSDPDRTLSLMSKVLSLPQIPRFYADNIPAWRQSVLHWSTERGKIVHSEEGLFLEASRLSKEANDLQAYPLDHSADILYLRSSAVAHELLTQYPGGNRASEAMLLAGTAYELLEDKLVSPLPDLYYEACIRNSPHTAIAETCYRRYEQSMLFGYSGTAGTFLPDEVQELMQELRMISQIKS